MSVWQISPHVVDPVWNAICSAPRNRAGAWARSLNQNEPRWTIDGPVPRASSLLTQTLRTGVRVMRVVLALACFGLVGLGGLAAYGYYSNPPEFWLGRIDALIQSPIQSTDGELIGSLGNRNHRLSADDLRRYAFIPLNGALPPLYVEGLLHAENRHYQPGKTGWRNVCGLDLIGSVGTMVRHPGRAGGSTLVQQLARNLKPEWQQPASFWQKVWRKGQELGAACRLHETLVDTMGPDGPLRLYASYSPVFQGGGSLRGIEAGARVTWGRAPQDLSDAQQLALASAARKPLALLSPGDTELPCNVFWPRQGNRSFDEAVARAHSARAVQCQALDRADSLAIALLNGERLAKAQAELETFRVAGIQPVNPFRPIPARRLVNLSSRTASTLHADMLRQIAQEADAAEFTPGEPLVLALDSGEQHRFGQAIAAALRKTQSNGASVLCLPLTDAPDTTRVAPCTESSKSGKAHVLAMRVSLEYGGVLAMYSSAYGLLDEVISIGSTAKWVIALAAVQEGYRAETLVCPRAAWDGSRRLRRVSHPLQGYTDCANGRNSISFREAIARSDNLAFYDVGRALGEARLREALDALGLPQMGEGNLAYALAFGTYGATARELLHAAQRLVASAHAVLLHGVAPRLLAVTLEAPPTRIRFAQDEAVALRTLLAAPVERDGGTLRHLRGSITGGKTGTLQSLAKTQSGRPYAHAKVMVAYDLAKGVLYLLLVSAPVPTMPLAKPEISTRVLLPLHRALIEDLKE